MLENLSNLLDNPIFQKGYISGAATILVLVYIWKVLKHSFHHKHHSDNHYINRDNNF